MHLRVNKDETAGPGPDEVGIAILTWLAGNQDMLSRFLALTGLEAHDLRHLSGTAGFNLSLLEFVTAHPPSLAAFSDASGIAPEKVARAWQVAAGPLYGGTGA